MEVIVYFIQGEQTLLSTKLLGIKGVNQEQLRPSIEKSLYLTLVLALWNDSNGFYEKLDTSAPLHIELRVAGTDALIHGSTELNMHPHNPVFALGTTESSLNSWVHAQVRLFNDHKRFKDVEPEEMYRYCVILGPKPVSLVQFATQEKSRLLYVLEHGFLPLTPNYHDHIAFTDFDENIPF